MKTLCTEEEFLLKLSDSGPLNSSFAVVVCPNVLSVPFYPPNQSIIYKLIIKTVHLSRDLFAGHC